MSLTSPVVFDAEPLLAYLDGEPGADAVERVVEDVRDDRIEGLVSYVTLAEVTYVAERALDEAIVRSYVETLQDYGIEPVDVAEVWRTAARYKNAHDVSLGDAIVLATASARDATAFVGADDDFEAVEEVPIERFRTDPA